ncbi:MAG: AMP-binding protein, partial [Gammaproteobacteria bacterium]|nr:AMP-binding protein [Gammaproteobacteria bacterium]
LSDERGSTSWAQLSERSNQLIHAFRDMGLDKGDIIAIYSGNCREYYEVMMAANHAGIIYVPVNWHFSPEELAYVIADSGARLL